MVSKRYDHSIAFVVTTKKIFFNQNEMYTFTVLGLLKRVCSGTPGCGEEHTHPNCMKAGWRIYQSQSDHQREVLALL